MHLFFVCRPGDEVILDQSVYRTFFCESPDGALRIHYVNSLRLSETQV